MFNQNEFNSRSNIHDNNVEYGYVVERESGPQGVFVRASLPDRGITTGKLPVLQGNTTGTKSFYLPRIGEFVKISVPSTGIQDAIVEGGLYTPDNPPPNVDADMHQVLFDDGSLVSFDPDKSAITVTTPGGTCVITLGGTMSLTVTGNVTVLAKANLTATVDGNLQATVDGTATIQAPTINLTGNVNISGNLSVTQNVTFGAAGTIATHLTNEDGEGGGS